jgi:hypothetical protein
MPRLLGRVAAHEKHRGTARSDRTLLQDGSWLGLLRRWSIRHRQTVSRAGQVAEAVKEGPPRIEAKPGLMLLRVVASLQPQSDVAP